MRRYGMNGLSGGPDHHAREAEKYLLSLDRLVGIGGQPQTVSDTFKMSSALAKALVHITEMPESKSKKALSRKFAELKYFVDEARNAVSQAARRCGRR